MTTTPEQLATRRALAERAAKLLHVGYHCSEAVVLAVGPHVVREWHPACARMATGFAGGVGGTHQELCGALAGGVMIIGALFGRNTLENDELAQRMTKRFRERFLETFDMTQCERLREEVVEPEGGLGSCAVLVQRTVMVLLNTLAEAGVQLKAVAEEPGQEAAEATPSGVQT
ncbi:MAG: C-GCAxxG-C-C family protein [Anaerolineae bacterium]